MKLYNSKNLFIGEVGHTYNTSKNGRSYLTIEKTGLAITKQKELAMDYYYFDTLSKIKYIDFHNWFCMAGELAIYKPVSLYSYIRNIYNETQKIKIISKITTKIINGKYISNKEISTLIYYLNNKESFAQNTVKSENNNNNANNSSNYVTVLTNEKFKDKLSIGIDNEMKELMLSLAQDKKNCIIIGENGVGKTTLINELAYRIQKNMIPCFLKSKKIIDITPLITNTKYTDKLENDIKNLIDGIIKTKDIIFIENIQCIFSINNYLSNIIRQELQNQNLKIIGTTNLQNYHKYFEDNNLDKYCKKVFIFEPNDEILYQIIENTFTKYSKNNNIKLLENIDDVINKLISATKKENRITNDGLYNDYSNEKNNPDLVIEIIDNIFAFAKVNNTKKLTIEDIIYGIKSCDKIIDDKKEEIILSFKETNQPKQFTKSRKFTSV